jgi:hypothetical protein
MKCLFALIAMTSVAVAEVAPTIDMTKVILDERHKPIKDALDRDPSDVNCDKCPELTIGSAVAHALFYVEADEKDISSEQKWAWAALAERIRDNKAATLTNGQLNVIEKRLGKLYGGIVLLRVMPVLDPNRKPPEVE